MKYWNLFCDRFHTGYNQDNIEEVAINRAGQVWLRLRGKRAYPWVMYKDEKLTKEYLTDLLYIVANTYEIPFDPVAGSPVVYASIPGEHRFFRHLRQKRDV